MAGRVVDEIALRGIADGSHLFAMLRVGVAIDKHLPQAGARIVVKKLVPTALELARRLLEGGGGSDGRRLTGEAVDPGLQRAGAAPAAVTMASPERSVTVCSAIRCVAKVSTAASASEDASTTKTILPVNDFSMPVPARLARDRPFSRCRDRRESAHAPTRFRQTGPASADDWSPP